MNSSRLSFLVVTIGLPILALVVWVAWSVPPLNGATGYAMVGLGALAMVVVITAALARAIGIRLPWLGAPHLYRLAGVLGVSLVLTAIGWASIYQHAAAVHAAGADACFAPITDWQGHLQQPHVGHWGSLYYTMGTLTTAGTGALEAASSTCQALTTVQLIENLFLVATAVSLAGSWFSKAIGARRDQRLQSQSARD